MAVRKTKKVLEKLQLEVKETLESLECIEVVSASSRNGDIRFLCRVTDDERWLSILSDFLAREGGWYSFIGKKYFSNNGNLVFGWVLIFESDELDETATEVRRLFRAIYDETVENKAKEPGEIEIALPFTTGYGERLQARVTPVKA